MNKIFISLIVAFTVLAALLMFQATRSSSATVLLPSQLHANNSNVNMSRIRVAGRVSAEDLSYELEPNIKLSFRISDPEGNVKSVPVVYQGLKPDMFSAGRDVIIDGAFQDGVLIANNLLTQCPSKYEPPKPGKAYETEAQE